MCLCVFSDHVFNLLIPKLLLDMYIIALHPNTLHVHVLYLRTNSHSVYNVCYRYTFSYILCKVCNVLSKLMHF